MKPTITNQKDLRKAFWDAWRRGEFRGLNVTPKKIKNYSGNGRMHNTDTRVCFVDWLDSMQKNGQLADGLAERATL